MTRTIKPAIGKPTMRDHLIACALNVGIPTSIARNLSDDELTARICRELDVEPTPPRFAHLTKVRDGYELTISIDTQPLGQVFKVENKKQARELCKNQNAQPWNF